jgi:hypothetical protein
MQHDNGHETILIPESIKRTAQGLAFTVKCCDEHEHSVHIQNAHEFADDIDALKRVVADHQRQAAQNHANHLAVEQFLKEECVKTGDCGCV